MRQVPSEKRHFKFRATIDNRVSATFRATSFANNGCLRRDSYPYCDLSSHLMNAIHSGPRRVLMRTSGLTATSRAITSKRLKLAQQNFLTSPRLKYLAQKNIFY